MTGPVSKIDGPVSQCHGTKTSVFVPCCSDQLHKSAAAAFPAPLPKILCSLLLFFFRTGKISFSESHPDFFFQDKFFKIFLFSNFFLGGGPVRSCLSSVLLVMSAWHLDITRSWSCLHILHIVTQNKNFTISKKRTSTTINVLTTDSSPGLLFCLPLQKMQKNLLRHTIGNRLLARSKIATIINPELLEYFSKNIFAPRNLYKLHSEIKEFSKSQPVAEFCTKSSSVAVDWTVQVQFRMKLCNKQNLCFAYTD